MIHARTRRGKKGKEAISLGDKREGRGARIKFPEETHLPDELPLLRRVRSVTMAESDVFEVTWRRRRRVIGKEKRMLGRLKREGRNKGRRDSTNRSLAFEPL